MELVPWLVPKAESLSLDIEEKEKDSNNNSRLGGVVNTMSCYLHSLKFLSGA